MFVLMKPAAGGLDSSPGRDASVSPAYSEHNVKVKTIRMHVYKPDILTRFSELYINYPQVLELIHSQSHPPGAHYCWVDTGGVDS